MLGYDAATGADVPHLEPEGISPADWMELTAPPRAYGFHATLKAPFHLQAPETERHLLAATEALAKRLPTLTLARLKLVELSDFLALRNADGGKALAALAREATISLDAYRAPLGERDLARRKAAQLTDRQADYLQRFGYPYVLEEFRFHMTLTGPLPRTIAGGVRDALLVAYLQRVPDQTCVIDALSVFRQERRNERFRLIARYPFGA